MVVKLVGRGLGGETNEARENSMISCSRGGGGGGGWREPLSRRVDVYYSSTIK